jgi:hypothetical protein
MKTIKGNILVIILILFIIVTFNDLFQVNIDQRDALNKKHADIISQNIYQWFNGTERKHYEGNNRDYNWYVDQFNTGPFSNNNCGPSVAVMSLKWLNKDFKASVIKAREKYYPNGDWW